VLPWKMTKRLAAGTLAATLTLTGGLAAAGALTDSDTDVTDAQEILETETGTDDVVDDTTTTTTDDDFDAVDTDFEVDPPADDPPADDTDESDDAIEVIDDADDADESDDAIEVIDDADDGPVDNDNKGSVISNLARTTEPGPGHGFAVCTEASEGRCEADEDHGEADEDHGEADEDHGRPHSVPRGEKNHRR